MSKAKVTGETLITLLSIVSITSVTFVSLYIMLSFIVLMRALGGGA